MQGKNPLRTGFQGYVCGFRHLTPGFGCSPAASRGLCSRAASFPDRGEASPNGCLCQPLKTLPSHKITDGCFTRLTCLRWPTSPPTAELSGSTPSVMGEIVGQGTLPSTYVFYAAPYHRARTRALHRHPRPIAACVRNRGFQNPTSAPVSDRARLCSLRRMRATHPRKDRSTRPSRKCYKGLRFHHHIARKSRLTRRKSESRQAMRLPTEVEP